MKKKKTKKNRNHPTQGRWASNWRSTTHPRGRIPFVVRCRALKKNKYGREEAACSRKMELSWQISSPATRLTAHAMKIVKRNLISSESNTSKWTSVKIGKSLKSTKMDIKMERRHHHFIPTHSTSPVVDIEAIGLIDYWAHSRQWPPFHTIDLIEWNNWLQLYVKHNFMCCAWSTFFMRRHVQILSLHPVQRQCVA